MRKYGDGVQVQDQGTGYTLERVRRRRAYRVALRMGPSASATDFQRVKRAAVRQLARLVAQAGERYDDGTLSERNYTVDGRVVWELCWHHRTEAGATVDRVGDGRGGAPLARVDAADGGAHAGGDRG